MEDNIWKPTHSDLVEIAMRWLQAKGFRVILAEPGYRKERPDVIGFSSGFSCLVECKVSRSDFLRDLKKTSRLDPAKGVGSQRVYLTLPGICTPDELPDRWQLVEVLDRDTVRLVHGAKGCLQMSKRFKFSEKDWKAENDLLYSWAYRKLNGCLKSVPKTGHALAIVEGLDR